MAKIEKLRVAIDSCTIISHLINNQPKHSAGLQSLFHEVDQEKVALLGSVVLLTEVLGGGFNDPPDLAKENQIRAILENPKVITLAQVTRQVAIAARDLRPMYKLKVADSLHLATAIFVSADFFMTVDEDFPIGHVVRGVKVVHPGSALGADVLPPA